MIYRHFMCDISLMHFPHLFTYPPMCVVGSVIRTGSLARPGTRPSLPFRCREVAYSYNYISRGPVMKQIEMQNQNK